MSRHLRAPGLVLAWLCLGVGFAGAQPQISGPQSGTLGPGTYLVTGPITVANGASLTIQPGTTFLHTSAWSWTISGQLTAVGTATDSIRFLRQSPSVARWGGLRFTPTIPQQNQVVYCVIEEASTSGAGMFGGGVYIMGNYLTLRHTRISRCQVIEDGGGIYAYYATALVVDSCIVDSCLADIGGGIYLNMSSGAQIKNSVITRNKCTGT
ncbi:MAG: right-handed parallel beta-helix repeat-containing protein [Candidatus Zixiibacteriota bacterium]|nr:MAG: right-handed parallel beta-helix repeat-containing protein [candidate division Zixibacteria bacterium]